MKNIIDIYLETFCIKVRKNEETSFVELMMDDHKCIEWGEKQYYIPENHFMYNEMDISIYKFLTTNCLVN